MLSEDRNFILLLIDAPASQFISFINSKTSTLNRTNSGCSSTQNQFRPFFRDHDRRRVNIAAGDGGHDRRIDNAEVFNAVNAKLRIDHGHVIDAHLARAGGMINGLGGVQYKLPNLLVRLYVFARRFFHGHVRLERRLVQDVSGDFDAFDHRFQIVVMRIIVRFDTRGGKGIARLQGNAAAALRMHLTYMKHKTMSHWHVCAMTMRVDAYRRKLKLQVWNLHRGIGFYVPSGVRRRKDQWVFSRVET